MRSHNNLLTGVENDTTDVRPVNKVLGTLVNFDLCHLFKLDSKKLRILAIGTSTPRAF